MPLNPHVGFAFPFRVDPEGRIARVGGRAGALPSKAQADESVVAGVKQIIQTSPGERVMLFQFGVGAVQLLFKPMGNKLVRLVERFTSQQLSLWEPRVFPTMVLVGMDVQDARVVVDLGLQYHDTAEDLSFQVEQARD